MENEIKAEKFLPIGSVVLLSGGTKKIMVTGFCSVAQEDTTKIYDYTGCIYPEGYLDFDQICLFDHSQIDKIFYTGYVDDEEKAFKEELNEMSSQIENTDGDISSFFTDADFEEDEEENDDYNKSQELVIPMISPEEVKETSDEMKTDELEYL